MGVETVYADAHITGTFLNPTNAVGNTPTTWAGELNSNTNYTSRWSLADLANALTPAATQTINILAKKGSNSGTPTISVNLYENGTLISTILATTNITSTAGQTLVATFLSSAISNPANVEIEVVETGAGGNPNTRNSAQIAYIEWVADVNTDPLHTGGGSGGSINVTGAGTGVKNTSGSGNGALTIQGAGSGGIFRELVGSSGGSVTISGAGAGLKRGSGGSAGSVVIQGAGQGVGKSPLLFLTKNVKRAGVPVRATVYKKVNGALIQTGGQTR